MVIARLDILTENIYDIIYKFKYSKWKYETVSINVFGKHNPHCAKRINCNPTAKTLQYVPNKNLFAI